MNINVDTTIKITIDITETPFNGTQADAIADEHSRLRAILNADITKFAKKILSDDTEDAFERGRIV